MNPKGTVTHWAIQWRENNQLDGKVRYFLWDKGRPLLFATRKAAREYIREKWGYIKTRPDLRGEPFGWRMPVAVKVKVVLTEDIR